MKKRRHVAVVGAGISGLSCAYYLLSDAARRGTTLECSIYEKEMRAGGKIRTVHKDGFVIEAGPDSFVTRKKEVFALAEDLDLVSRLVPVNSGAVGLVLNGEIVPMPGGMGPMVPGRLLPFLTTPLLTLRGKLRALAEPLVSKKKGGEEESVASFVRRRFGRELSERIAEPLMGGIHLADPEKLSIDAAFPHYREAETANGSLIGGTRKRKRGESGLSFHSLAGGMGELPGAIEGRLGEEFAGAAHIHKGCTIDSIEPDREGAFVLRGSDRESESGSNLSVAADAVVLSTAAHVSAGIVCSAYPELSALLSDIRYVSSASVTLAFDRGGVFERVHGNGFIVPRNEGYGIRGCTWSSNKISGRAPDGSMLARAFVGGAGEEELVEYSDNRLIDTVCRDISRLLGANLPVPVTAEVFRFPDGTPQYEVGHLDTIKRINRLCGSGLYVAGSAYRGVGIPDCIADALSVSGTVIDYMYSKEKEVVG